MCTIFRSLLFISVFSWISALQGCATVDQKISLNYSNLERSFGHNSGDIVVSRNEQQQMTKNSQGEWIIGSINNVHGVHQANLLSDRSIGEWITDALMMELKRAGYKPTYASILPANSARALHITDINAFLNVNKGTVTDDIKQELKFNIEIYLNGLKAKTFTVASRENKTLPFSASREEEEKVMLQSLQDAIQQIIPEINVLTGKK